MVGCSVELSDEAIPVDEIWSTDPTSPEPDEEIAFADRDADQVYGLPREGGSSIADLIELFPETPLRGGDPDIFVAADTRVSTDQCRGGEPVELDELPMTVEGVITLHPRQYMKVQICGQDERHYGAYTVEDDTGGIIVLRDSRVAPFSFGDRVRVEVHALTLTFGPELDTRAILVADVEIVADLPEGEVLYQPLEEPFSSDHVARVHQVRGFVHVEPTNQNFNSMILTSSPIGRSAGGAEMTGELLQCVRTCEVRCLDNCPSSEACADICPEACLRDGGAAVDPATLPTCWMIGLDAELGRRGYSPAYGTELRVRGPVVNNFDVQMWVMSTGQVDEL